MKELEISIENSLIMDILAIIVIAVAILKSFRNSLTVPFALISVFIHFCQYGTSNSENIKNKKRFTKGEMHKKMESAL